jgi:hypothetical protein
MEESAHVLLLRLFRDLPDPPEVVNHFETVPLGN